jgi:ADP-ribosyl-[dinitrogen reductase] hydrolase
MTVGNVDIHRRERAIIGCLLGTAVGDAIGLPYEGLSPHRATRLLGPPDRHRFFLRRGMISDDTDHACMVAESLIASQTPDGFGHEFARRLRKWICCMPAGVGFATLRAGLKLVVGISPARSGVFSAGNGPAMRSAIIGAAIEDHALLRELVANSTRITHVDPRAEHGALAVALAARRAASGEQLSPETCLAYIQTFCNGESSQELIELLRQAATSVGRRETTWDFAKSIGLDRGVTGFVNRTVPIVFHACWSHPSDFESAVQAAIYCGGDADTTAAIVGGIIGSYVGKEGIPTNWLVGVRDWPRSTARIERLGHQLSHVDEPSFQKDAANVSTVAMLSRNVLFAAIVICHGIRRLFPPY